jgi:hypothetical protein
MSPAKLQPALLGGLAMGVLSALPVVMMANCCCCAWLLFGGALSSYLMQQDSAEPILVGDGAVVGLMAGAFGAAVWLVASLVINSVLAPFQAGLVEQVMRNAASLPPEARAFFENLPAEPSVGVGLVFGFFVMLVVSTMFGMIGGIFGALMFRKSAPPVTPPPIPQ